MLSREEILSKKDLKKELVNVPEWGGDVFVSEMTAESRDNWEQSLINNDKKIINPRAKLIAATVVDQDGNRLFSFDDVDALGKLSGSALSRLADVAQKVNGLTTSDIDAIDNAKKN